MRNMAVIIATYFIVFAAGFGNGAFVMYMKTEPLIFAWMNNANGWQHEAESNRVDAEYYRQNAIQNIYVAEQLRELYDNEALQNEALLNRLKLLEHELHEVLNPSWEVN